jgi:Uma2 family endonuclease
MSDATSLLIDPAKPSAADANSLYEIVDGQRVEPAPMGVYEVHIATTLVRFLAPFVSEHGLGRLEGEMLFQLDATGDLQRRPDVAFVSYGRWPRGRKVPRTAAWEVVPDLVIEVVSPTNSASEIVEKLDEYFRAGVRVVWVIYPIQSRVHVWESPKGARVLAVGEELDGGEELPRFRLSLAELFEDEAETPG